MSKQFRAAVAAFAAVGVIAATGVVGVVSAAAADTGPTRSVEADNPRLPATAGPTIAEVKATGTHGPTAGSLNTFSACEDYADEANLAIAAGLKELYGGNMAGAGEKFAEALTWLDRGRTDGCTFE